MIMMGNQDCREEEIRSVKILMRLPERQDFEFLQCLTSFLLLFANYLAPCARVVSLPAPLNRDDVGGTR